MVKVVFSVDDVSAKVGYGLLWNNDPIKYLSELNKEFGAKFTCFIIPHYHNEKGASLENNPQWCEKIRTTEWIEPAMHGYYHMAIEPKYIEMEFAGLNPQQVEERIKNSIQMFKKMNIPILGAKNPGWYIEPYHYDLYKKLGIKYIGDHFVGSKAIEQNGIYRVPYLFCIHEPYHMTFNEDDTIILHSHINPKGGNQNAWTKENYEKVREFLLGLQNKFENVEFIFMRDMI